jgi:hypothetical protein
MKARTRSKPAAEAAKRVSAVRPGADAARSAQARPPVRAPASTARPAVPTPSKRVDGSGSRSSKPILAPAAGGPSTRPRAVAVALIAPTGGRFKRWKMIRGKRHVWWVDSTGQPEDATMAAIAALTEDDEEQSSESSAEEKEESEEKEEETPPPEPEEAASSSSSSAGSDDSDSGSSSDSSSAGARGRTSSPPTPRMIVGRPSTSSSILRLSKGIPLAHPSLMVHDPNRRQFGGRLLQLSDLSPLMRVAASHSGVRRMLAAMDGIIEEAAKEGDFDDEIDRHLEEWRDEGLCD